MLHSRMIGVAITARFSPQYWSKNYNQLKKRMKDTQLTTFTVIFPTYKFPLCPLSPQISQDLSSQCDIRNMKKFDWLTQESTYATVKEFQAPRASFLAPLNQRLSPIWTLSK